MPRHSRRSRRIDAAVPACLALGMAALAVAGDVPGWGSAAVPGTTEPAPFAASAGAAPSLEARPVGPWASPAGPSASPSGPSAGPGAATGGWRVQFAWHVPVLMYHLVATPGDAEPALPGLVVSPTLFRAQLQAAWRAGWRTITASQLARAMAAGREPPPQSFVVTIDDGHEDGWTEAFPILRAFGFVATYFLPSARIGRAGDLSGQQVQALAQAGMEVANHSVDHVPLAHLAPAEARGEIDGAQAAIAALLGASPITLAYPFGNRDLQVIRDVAAAGIGLAFTTVEGCSESLAGRLDEPRLRVSPWTTPADLVAQLRRCAGLATWG